MLHKEANQPETVYIGKIFAEERTSTSMGEEVDVRVWVINPRLHIYSYTVPFLR